MDIYKANKQDENYRFLCSGCKVSLKNTKTKCCNVKCPFETSTQTLFQKDKNFNSNNKTFSCPQCNQYEKELYEYQEKLDEASFFSGQNEAGKLDSEIYIKVKKIQKGFTLSNDDDLNALSKWFDKLKLLDSFFQSSCMYCLESTDG